MQAVLGGGIGQEYLCSQGADLLVGETQSGLSATRYGEAERGKVGVEGWGSVLLFN